MKSVLLSLMMMVFLSGHSNARAEDVVDSRQVVTLSPVERAWMLGEMRNNLSTIALILTALANGETEQARKLALERGTIRTNDPERKSIRDKAPDGWKPFSGNVHKGFDSIAESIGNHAPQSQTLLQMGSLLQNCAACHAAYRVH
jgi:cytochrome c556